MNRKGQAERILVAKAVESMMKHWIFCLARESRNSEEGDFEEIKKIQCLEHDLQSYTQLALTVRIWYGEHILFVKTKQFCTLILILFGILFD